MTRMKPKPKFRVGQVVMVRRKTCVPLPVDFYWTPEKIKKVTSFSGTQLYWLTIRKEPKTSRMVSRNRRWHYLFENNPNPAHEGNMRRLQRNEY